MCLSKTQGSAEKPRGVEEPKRKKKEGRKEGGVTDTPRPQDGIRHSGRGKESPAEVFSPKGLSPPARVGVRLAPISKTLSWSRTGNLPSGTLGNVSLSGSVSVRYILLSQHFCLLWYALDVGKKNCHVNLCSFV